MRKTSFHIVVAEPYDDGALERLRSVGRVTVLPSCDAACLASAVPDCDALLVRSYTLLDESVLARAGRLKVIGRGGSGLDNIDLAAAHARGIVVVHTPSASTQAVADLTIGLMVSLVRRIVSADRAVRAGLFGEERQRLSAAELSELTLGIVGLGRIGKEVARRSRSAFGMNILYNDIVEPGWLDFVATPVDKPQLYRESDIVSLHVSLTTETRSLINAAALSQFRRGAMLINTARGAVVDGCALADALDDGRLAGAALDVVDPEPLPERHPLLMAPNTIFTPHIGARTSRSLARMNDVVDDVIAVLRGRSPRYAASGSGLADG